VHRLQPARLELEATVDLGKTAGDQELPYISGLTFLPDGRVVAVDHMNDKCIVLSATLVRLGTGYQFQAYPSDVTCFNGDNLAVTLGFVFYKMYCF